MKKKFFNVLFIVLFMLVLFVPLALVSPGGTVSERENRFLAERPPIGDLFKDPKGYFEQFGNWFSDNMGFREQAITLYNRIESSGFQVQYMTGQVTYLVGQQGHHFFAGIDGEMIPKFQGAPILSDDNLRQFANNLEGIRIYLESMGIPFIVMFNPDKESVYPEYFPRSVRRSPDPIPYETLVEYLRENTGIDILDVRPRLVYEKEFHPVFNRDNSGDLAHYSELGAFFAYQELMWRINAYMPELEPFTLDDIDIIYDADIPLVSLKQVNFTPLEISFFDNVPLRRPFLWENLAYKNNDDELPTILLMRGSSAGTLDYNFFNGYVPEHFGLSLFIYFFNMSHFTEYVDLYKPDIVVFQIVERMIGWFSSYVANWNSTDSLAIQSYLAEYTELIAENHTDYVFVFDSINRQNPNERITLGDEVFMIDGWAVNRLSMRTFDKIIMGINGIYYTCPYLPRRDVAEFFESPGVLNSGFFIYISGKPFDAGENEIEFILVCEEQKIYYRLKYIIEVGSISPRFDGYTESVSKNFTDYVVSLDFIDSQGLDAGITLHGGLVSVEGWAINWNEMRPFDRVYLAVNGRYFVCSYSKREDVYDFFGNPAFLNAGFNVYADAEAFTIGVNTLEFIMFCKERQIYYRHGYTVNVESILEPLFIDSRLNHYIESFSHNYGDYILSLDIVNGQPPDLAVTLGEEVFLIAGWAINVPEARPFDSILLGINGEYFACLPWPREDVADYFENPDLLNTGYYLYTDSAPFTTGENTLEFILICDTSEIFHRAICNIYVESILP